MSRRDYSEPLMKVTVTAISTVFRCPEKPGSSPLIHIIETIMPLPLDACAIRNSFSDVKFSAM